MADFNSDNQKTDAALHGLAEQAAGKADAAALTAAVNRVSALENGKADQSTLAAEQAARQNADNAEKAAREAADAALDKRAGAQFIRTETMTEASKYFSVPLNDINWSEWRELHFIFQAASESVDCDVSFNGHSGMSIDGPLGQRWHVIACPCFTPEQPISGFVFPFARTFGTFCSKYSFQDVKYLGVSTSESTLQPGTSVTVWGVK